MGNTLTGNRFKFVNVPDVEPLNIPHAKYAYFDYKKKSDDFTKMKRAFEEHASSSPEETFSYMADENRMTSFLQYANKLCKAAKDRDWKCDVSSFGNEIKIQLDK